MILWEVKKINILSMGVIMGLAVACGSTDKKTGSNSQDTNSSGTASSGTGTTEVSSSAGSRALGNGMGVDDANGQLAKVPILGFPPFSNSMPITQFDQYGENAATVAKNVVASLPEGYKLQIIGHANQHPSKSAAYTQSLSLQRAKYVYEYFVKKGIDKSKMTYVGVGNSDPDPNLSHADNRRVTFRLVKK